MNKEEIKIEKCHRVAMMEQLKSTSDLSNIIGTYNSFEEDNERTYQRLMNEVSLLDHLIEKY